MSVDVFGYSEVGDASCCSGTVVFWVGFVGSFFWSECFSFADIVVFDAVFSEFSVFVVGDV